MINSLLTSNAASRFFARWMNAVPTRAELLQDVAGLSLSVDNFARLLQNQTAAGASLPAAMRRLRNLVIAALIERDLGGRADLAEVVDTMTALAEFAVNTHLTALMEDLTALHGMPVGENSGLPQQLMVLGMGKLGGGELNVSSDIDLIFVYPEEGETRTTTVEQRSLSNHEFFTRLGKKLISALSEINEDGFTFRVDMALRPNGASGPLVANLNMVERYLIVQGREWERYAWIKARAITGNATDIAALESIVLPFIYRRYLDFGSIDALRSMHAQIRAEVMRQETRHPDRNTNVKLGRGGIREIEFLAQVFQLIRGGRDPELRQRSTRDTLLTLASKGLLTETAVQQLQHAYTFLRNLEHRLQYLDDAQTHTLPTNQEDQLRVAQMMGYADIDTLLTELELQRSQVAAQFDAIFSEPQQGQAPDGSNQGDALGDPRDDCTLTDHDAPETVTARLAACGFGDAAAAARRLLATWQSPRMQSLPDASSSRLATLINAALPMIGSMPHGREATLSRLLDLLEAIAGRAAYLALLIEYPYTLMRVIRMINASGWAAQYLTQHPILLDEILDDRNLKAESDWPAFGNECQRQLDAAEGDTERQMDILREMHHAQVFRLLAQDLEGALTVERLADELSALADLLVAATIRAVWHTLSNRHTEIPRFAVIAYGKLGGKELGYVSDLDVIFLYDDAHPEAPALYAKLAQRFITWMTSHTSAGTLFDIDIALRPDGASGLLVSSLDNFRRYQLSSAWVWEHQALTRARFCAGDHAIGIEFEAIRSAVLLQPRPSEPLKQEVNSMRQKLHAAHRNRTTWFDLKQDAGGMIDIEFMVQYLVLCHAAQYPQLIADIGNIGLLRLCSELGLIDSGLASQVADAYRTLRRLQHQLRLQGESQAQVAPTSVAAEASVVRQLWHTVLG